MDSELALAPDPDPGPGPVHKPEPLAGTLYSESGINTGLPADVRFPVHFPMTAHCSCGEILRAEWYPELGVAGWWQHTGRQAGE